VPDQLGSAARRDVAVDRAAHPCEGRRETDGDGWGGRGTGGDTVGQPARMPRVACGARGVFEEWQKRVISLVCKGISTLNPIY
jgi:hypothetical protein